jgi:SpoIID/LytB domain protein
MSQWGARGLAAAGFTAADILSHYYQGTLLQSRAVVNDVRVLAADSSTVTLAAAGVTILSGPGWSSTLTAGQQVAASPSAAGLVVSGAVSVVSPGPVTVSLSTTAPVRLSPPGYRYARGVLTVSSGGSGVRAVVSGLTMQQYLYGLGEVPSSWPTEALRAQAIAGRTYAERILERTNRYASDFDLYGSVFHQAYIGWDKEAGVSGPLWQRAVDDTDLLTVTYQSTPIEALFSASSGGYTENSEMVFPTARPYLRGVADPADLTGNNPNASWSVPVSPAQLGAWFSLPPVSSVVVSGAAGVSGRTDKATVTLQAGSSVVKVSGTQFRSTLNAHLANAPVRSTKYTVTAV